MGGWEVKFALSCQLSAELKERLGVVHFFYPPRRIRQISLPLVRAARTARRAIIVDSLIIDERVNALPRIFEPGFGIFSDETICGTLGALGIYNRYSSINHRHVLASEGEACMVSSAPRA